jgi:Sec7-like guanine-nucleotide exchange factor
VDATKAVVGQSDSLNQSLTHSVDDDIETQVDAWCNVNEEIMVPTPLGSPHRRLLLTPSQPIRTSLSDSILSPISNSSPTLLGSSPEEIQASRMNAAEVLRARRLKKQHLKLVAEKFNDKPLKSEWISYATQFGILTSAASSSGHESKAKVDAKQIARFLRQSPGLGKVQIGEYISKGPKEQYPFHAEVLREYVDTFSFAGKSFDKALRIFLGTC